MFVLYLERNSIVLFPEQVDVNIEKEKERITIGVDEARYP